MTVEEAINTSIEYETKVRDVYMEAVEQSEHPEGKKLFQLMADEEQHHLDYLEAKLAQWREDGTVTADGLTTLLPPADKIEEGVEKLKDKVGGKPATVDVQFLRKAHAVERETSAFYKQVVRELPDEGKELFRRFMEIEEGHLALVQAQLDLALGTGFWFDVQEFNLEAY